VIINPDGSIFHVPTIVKINSRCNALINDLRSSATYSVIWNPQDFADVKTHWGQMDVNKSGKTESEGEWDNTFLSDRSVTRSEFAVIVVYGLVLMNPDAQPAKFSECT